MTQYDRILEVLADRKPHTAAERIPAIGLDVVASRSVLLKLKRSPATPEEGRFFPKVQADDNGCWNWTGCKVKGYGSFRFEGRPHPAHRVIYSWFYGPESIVDLDVDHLCRNRSCVNPLHLEAVTHAENVARQERNVNAPFRTHCGRGHALTGANAIIREDSRCIRCRTCMNLRYAKAEA